MKEIIYRNKNGELERHQFETRDATLYTIRGLLHLEDSDFDGNELPAPIEVGGEQVKDWKVSEMAGFVGDCWFTGLSDRKAEELDIPKGCQSESEKDPDREYEPYDRRLVSIYKKIGSWIRENGLVKPIALRLGADPHHVSNDELSHSVNFFIPMWNSGLIRNDGSEIKRELYFDPGSNTNPRMVLYVESDDYGFNYFEFFGYRIGLTDWWYIEDLLDAAIGKYEGEGLIDDYEEIDESDEHWGAWSDPCFDGGTR